MDSGRGPRETISFSLCRSLSFCRDQASSTPARPAITPLASSDASPPPTTVATAVQRVSATTRLPPSRVPPNAGGGAQTAFPGLAVIGKGGGQPLSPRIRAHMAHRVGADFSDLRVYTAG